MKNKITAKDKSTILEFSVLFTSIILIMFIFGPNLSLSTKSRYDTGYNDGYSKSYNALCKTRVSRTNGLAEALVKIVTSQLRALGAQASNWHDYIPQITMVHNYTVSQATGRTPASYLFRLPHTVPVHNILPEDRAVCSSA